MEHYDPDKCCSADDERVHAGRVSRRIEARNRVFLRATIIPALDSSDICIENVSRSGLRGTSNISMVVGQFVVVSFDGPAHLRGIVRWVSDCRFGVEFDSPFGSADDPGYDEHPLSAGFPPREKRLVTNLCAKLIRIAPPTAGRIRNISPSGMMLEIGSSFEPGRKLFVKLANGMLVDGTVRWANASLVGLELTNQISADTFHFGGSV